MSLDRRKEVIKQLAVAYGWAFFEEQSNPPMLSFKRSGERINVYYTTMTVVTCLNHPQQGKKSLVRREVNGKMLKAIFHNPRVHTGKGYHTKDNYVKPYYPYHQKTSVPGNIAGASSQNSGPNAGSIGSQRVLPKLRKEQPRATSLANFINRAIKFFRGTTGTR